MRLPFFRHVEDDELERRVQATEAEAGEVHDRVDRVEARMDEVEERLGVYARDARRASS